MVLVYLDELKVWLDRQTQQKPGYSPNENEIACSSYTGVGRSLVLKLFNYIGARQKQYRWESRE